MSTVTPAVPRWDRIVRQGLAAGVAGAVLLDASLYAAAFQRLHGSFFALAARNAGYIHLHSPWIGMLAHLCVSLGWGVGYAYIADTRPYLSRHPWLSGIAFGVVVWLIMQFVLMAGAVWTVPTAQAVTVGIIAHAVFFGLPVAWTVRALSRPAA